MRGPIRFQDLIVFEDDYLAVIHKPAGISSLHERAEHANSIIEMARLWNPQAQLCHRIDKDTSGALLIAKHEHVYRDLSILFEKRQIQKTYIAIVWGVPEEKEFSCELPISPTARGRAKIDRREGKPSTTHFLIREQFGKTSVIEAMPVSGRLHQIRVHLSALGLPLLSDEMYGGKQPFLGNFKRKYRETSEAPRPMIDRFALHAAALNFEWNDTQYNISVALPEDMAVLLKLLKKYDV